MRPRTRIRRMWDHDGVVTQVAKEQLCWRRGRLVLVSPDPVLVLPLNPACRLAQITRTVNTLWPKAKGKARERREAEVMIILGTALTP